MSAAVPVLTALLLMAFAGVLLQRYSPAFALLLSLGAAVWLLLRLAQPLRGVLQAMVQLGPVSYTHLTLPTNREV